MNKKVTYSHSKVFITQTPMRITLGGGGTDVIWYSKKRGGSWISAAINKYVYVFLNKTDDPNILKVFDGNKYYAVDNLKALENPVLEECLKMTDTRKGVQITTISEVIGRSGLGGSGSFEVGLLNALYSYKGKKVSILRLAEQAASIEIEKLKKSVGPQDQYIASIGGINYFEIDTNGKVTFEKLKISEETVKFLEKNLLYFSTGINRDADKVLKDQKRKAEKSNNSLEVFDSLDKIKDIGYKVKKYLLKGEVDKFGMSLHEHWLVKKSLSGKVSNSEIDNWYEAGIQNGALGGKIMGAGGGGWFVFYVNNNHQTFKNKMQKLGLIPQNVKFDWQGTKLLNINN